MAKKIVIIGGGVAGLSTGIYGQMNGYETEIIEMHSIPGGQCTAWDRKGYRFDYCLHWLVGSSKGPLYDIWKETNVINNSTVILDHDIHTKMVNDKGEEFIIYTNIDRWEKYLIEMAPIDAPSIKKMCNDMRKMAKFDFPESDDFSGKLKWAWKMMPIFPMFIKYGKKSCGDYFKELNFKDARMSYFCDRSFGDMNFSALAFIMMLSWFDQKNAGYIIGGSLPFAQRMAEKYKSLGGKLTVNKKVAKITVVNDIAKGVVLEDGTSIKADYVVSASDGYNTIFKMLEGKYVSKLVKDAYESWDLFPSIVQVSFGINDKVTSDVNALTCITENTSIGSTKLKMGYSILNYSFDPTMAPEGKSTIVIRFESPWEIWKDMSKEQYKAEKEKIKNNAIALLEKKHPGISQKVEVSDVATPLTDVKYTGVQKGAYEGFLPSPKNITKSLKNTLPNLQNFYMAGQWLYPGGGLPPAAQSGKKVISCICKKDKKEFSVIK
jgi:phytoene dehydrogenase-like protein